MINIQETPQITRIYLVTNCLGNPNKVYIGKTKNCRKNDHKRTYGKDITYDYIDEVNSLNRKDWTPLECFWIEYFRQLGFDIQNPNKRGGGGPGFVDEETKLKISKGNNGKILSQSTRNKLKCPRPGSGPQGPRTHELKEKLKKPKTEKHKLNISLSKKGISHSQETINKLSKPRSKEAKINMSYPKSEIHKNNISIGHYKPILQYTKENILIKEWISITEASNELKLNYTAISKCCRGKIKSSGNYIWKFKNNNNE